MASVWHNRFRRRTVALINFQCAVVRVRRGAQYRARIFCFAGKFRERVGVMDIQPRVETVEEFKLRIAAIIRATPEHIPGAPRPNPLLVRPKKRAKSSKAQRR